jgi:Zn-dependent M16 (insulinase) family peptidase
MKGDRAIANYISGLTQDDIQRQRDEILGTTQEDIIKFADLARDVMKQDYICVLGNEAKIKENKDIFGKLVNVFE